MAIAKKSAYSVGDVNFSTLMDSTDKGRIGLHSCSLTNYDNTSAPALSAGSVIEIDGTLYCSDTETAITGSPSDGDVYIKTVPDGDSCTLEYTNTAPTWDAVRQGWYSPTGGEETYRYLEFKIVKASASYTKYVLNKISENAQIYSGNSYSNTYFPIGSYIYASHNTVIALPTINSHSTTIYSSQYSFHDSLTIGASLLDGTWAVRGISSVYDGSGNYAYHILYQRIL